MPIAGARAVDPGAAGAAAAANVGLNTLQAVNYGIVANQTSAAPTNTTKLNDLLKLAELQNAVVQLAPGTTYVNGPVVRRANTWIKGNVGGNNAIRLSGTFASSVTQCQRYISTALAWNSGTTYGISYANGATAFCTYLGSYWISLVTGNLNNTPGTDFQHWAQLGPVSTTTFANAAATINQTPQSLTVTSGAPFGQFGGTMNFTVSGTTYALNYTGVSGNIVLGCTIATGSVTIAGTEAVVPNDITNSAMTDLTLHAGWASQYAPGSFYPVDNYSSTLGGDYVKNVTVQSGTGDGWANFGGTNGFAYNGQRVMDGCKALGNAGTGKRANIDSFTTKDQCGYNGLGAHYFSVSSSTMAASKSFNNGRQSSFKAVRTVADGVTNGTTTFTSATANWVADDIGQGIYDGASPGAGDIPANTFIFDVINSTTITLSQAATASHTGLTTNIAGYYWWPVANNNNANPRTGVIGVNDGIFYVLRVASITGLSTNPSADTTNWQPVRTATDWGFAMTETTGENNVQLDGQGERRGIYNGANGTVASTLTLTGNGWASNPFTWNNSTGAITGAYSNPTNLSVAAAVSIVGATNKNIRISLSQTVAESVGNLIAIDGTTTNCHIDMTSDANYANLLATGVPGSTVTMTWNGTPVGLWAVDGRTRFSGPHSSGAACLAQTSDYSLCAGSNVAGQSITRCVAIWLPAGVRVNRIGWASGSAPASSPTHQWLGLHDLNGVLLANVADQTSAAVAANTAYDYATTADFLTTYSGLYYLSLSLAASVTNATIANKVNVTGPSGVTPVPGGTGGTVVTPGNITVPLVNGFTPWLWCGTSTT